MNATVGSNWRTSAYDVPDQFDAWGEKLSAVYGSWNLDSPRSRCFEAELISHSVGSMQIVNCLCGPCGATRTRAAAFHDDRDVLAVQVVLSGRENFTIDNNRRILGPGDVLIWNTTRPMSFEVVEQLHKVSLMMPLTRLRHWLPNSWSSIDSLAPNGTSGARLLSSFVNSLFAEFGTGALTDDDSLIEAAIGIIVSTLGSDKKPVDSTSLREVQYMRVLRYIDAHLGDSDLSPASIAAANRISLRYLHWLFEPTGTTVLQHVIRERLLRCRRELLNPAMEKRTIKEIAYSWGFQNCTHFSRRFKDEFGVTPHEMRAEKP